MAPRSPDSLDLVIRCSDGPHNNKLVECGASVEAWVSHALDMVAHALRAQEGRSEEDASKPLIMVSFIQWHTTSTAKVHTHKFLKGRIKTACDHAFSHEENL